MDCKQISMSDGFTMTKLNGMRLTKHPMKMILCILLSFPAISDWHCNNEPPNVP